jgi:uridine phosphorylase
MAAKLQAERRAWELGGVLCWEMEAAALYVLSRVLGTRAGGIILALTAERHGPENLCETAVAGLRRLIEHDRRLENATGEAA